MPEGDVVRVHCNSCGQPTKHIIVAVRKQPGSERIRRNPWDEGYEINWEDRYSLLECCGCEEVTVKRAHWFSEEPEEEHVEFFPPRVSRREPRWLGRLPENTAELMREIYGALQADHRRLALMGARTVIDTLLLRTIGDAGTFAQKLNALEDAGFLSAVNREVLEAALSAGHAAIHRGYEPSSEDMNRVMDIVENVLRAEMLPDEAERLREAIPERDAGGSKPSSENSEDK